MIITPDRVVKIIEGMIMLDMPETMGLESFSSVIYGFCHIARGDCNSPHEKYVERFLKMEKEVLYGCGSRTDRERMSSKGDES